MLTFKSLNRACGGYTARVASSPSSGSSANDSSASGPSSSQERVRRLLRLYMRSRRATLQQVASGLRIPVEEIAGRLDGGDPVDLDWVERVLKVLDVPPGEFFARLYSDEPLSSEPGDGATPTVRPETEDEILGREEVEGLVREARSLIQGATRMIEARERADRESE